jgi:ATP-binding cassette subfamily C protein
MIRSFLHLLVRCYRMALPYGRAKLFVVLGLILFNGLLQLVGVTSVFPFFALAADPERLRKSHAGAWVLHFLPALTSNQLLVGAGCFAIAMLVFASLGSMTSEVLRIRYAYGFGHWLRGRLFESYASQPYEFFLRRNSAELNQRLWDVNTFTGTVLLPVGEILSRLVLVTLLLGAVFFVQPWAATGAILIFGGFYLLVFLWLRPRARAVGQGLQLHNVGFGKNTNQFLQGVKPVLIHDKARYFMDRALEHSARIGHFQAKIQIYSNGPRYLIEPVAFGGLMAIVVVLALRGRSFADILPNLTVMAFAGYRLLPALQLLYGQLVSIASNHYTLTQLEAEIREWTVTCNDYNAALRRPASATDRFFRSVCQTTDFLAGDQA